MVGFARASGDASLVGLLHDVAVAPSHRRTGVGGRLLSSLLSQLRGLGIGDIGLLTSDGTRAFFAACSFAPDADGAVHMALPPCRTNDRPQPGDYIRTDALREAMRRELQVQRERRAAEEKRARR